MTELGTATAPDTLRIERVLPATCERVWRYLVDPEKRAMWFAGGTTEPREGGKVTFAFDHDRLSEERYPPDYVKYKGAAFGGTVLIYDPPKVLAYTWMDEDGEGSSEVLFELTPKGKETLLVITHRKVTRRESMVSFASGWDAHVGILADLLAGRKPRGFWTAHHRARARYEKRLEPAHHDAQRL